VPVSGRSGFALLGPDTVQSYSDLWQLAHDDLLVCSVCARFPISMRYCIRCRMACCAECLSGLACIDCKAEE
jgi:hypothetical protein